MTMEHNAGAEPQRIYEEFKTYCKWPKPDTVEIHLPAGFRREDLKVQTNNVGILTIHGERPPMNTRSRFQIEIKLADKNCDPNKVRAKLVGRVLTVTMPQKVSNVHNSITALLSRSKLVGKDVALKLVGAVAVVVAFGLGAYVAKYYKHCTHIPIPISYLIPKLDSNSWSSCYTYTFN